MKKLALLLIMVFGIATNVYAVPVLQVGAPADLGDDGTYADYSTIAPDEDTAFTSGDTILVGGVYGNQTLNLGGEYDYGDGLSAGDWSDVDDGYNLDLSTFDGHGAVLIASIDASANLAEVATTMTIADSYAFDTATENFFFPNDHYPVKTDISNFLFFDIGDFLNAPGAVIDFADESSEAKSGEVKSLAVGGEIADLDWIHFDVMAIETSTQGRSIKSTFENNPGSHDVTLNPAPVPEPATMFLLGSGLMGLGWTRRKKKNS